MRSRKTKRYMSRFNGISKVNFWVYLKEYEGRLNTPDPKRQLLNLKRWVTKHMG
jgi:transposase-like protein